MSRVERVTKIDDDLHKLIVESGDEFHLEAKIPGSFKPHTFLNNWNKILLSGIGALWKFESFGKLTGLFGAVLFPDLCDGEIVAQEAFWYIQKGSRGAVGGIWLYREFMEWAQKVQAKRVIITHLVSSKPEKLEKFYLAEGFRKIEVNYLKELQ